MEFLDTDHVPPEKSTCVRTDPQKDRTPIFHLLTKLLKIGKWRGVGTFVVVWREKDRALGVSVPTEKDKRSRVRK